MLGKQKQNRIENRIADKMDYSDTPLLLNYPDLIEIGETSIFFLLK